MWRFHRVHHSIAEMYATNSYHHVAEDFFQFVAVTIPMSYLLGVEAGPVPWLVVVLANAAGICADFDDYGVQKPTISCTRPRCDATSLLSNDGDSNAPFR
jgi:sterol desaturase/sphingolipid hydroxylase (fatty acid hydroxylase superfamily)